MLSQPLPNAPQFGLSGREESGEIVESHAFRICGLVYSNADIAARLNVFGPLAFGNVHPKMEVVRRLPVNQLVVI